MKLKQLSLNNFRCLENRKIDFDPTFNIIYGRNGQGKTSLIEAVFFLATGKSFRTKKIKELTSYDKIRTIVFGSFESRENTKSIAIDSNNDKKEYYIDKTKTKYIDYVGILNVISFIPEDIEIIIGNPSVRRGFFNYEISQTKNIYLKTLVDFEKILKTRNKLIKERKTNKELYHIYNEKFIDEGSKIILMRKEYVKNISRLLNLNYRKLFDANSELRLKYDSFIENIDKMTLEEIKEKFREETVKKHDREKRYGYTLVGPQKEDFVFELNGKNAKAFSSQGEKKSIIFSLKIAEIDMLIKEKNEIPVFLIDDISSYFDEIRKNSILNYFKNKNIQCFITSTEKLDIEGKKIYIDKGRILSDE